MPTDRLLHLWRSTHHPAVFTELERVSAEILAHACPLEGRGERELLAAWQKLAGTRDSVAVPQLLQTAFEGRSTQVSKRLERLAGFSEDPRIGVAAAESLREWNGSASDADDARVVARLFDLLVVHGFHGTIDFKTTWELPRARAQLARVRTAFSARPVRPLKPTEQTELAQLKAPLKAKVMLTAGASSEARAVAVDALLEAGGPRAEFLALQMKRHHAPLTRNERTRQAALLRQCGRSWMGKVAKVMERDDAVFTDGMLSAGRVSAQPRQLAAVRDAPEWCTVRRLEFPLEVDVELLRRWPTITEVVVDSATGVAALARATPPLAVTSLSVSAELLHRGADDTLHALANGLPALEHFGLRSEFYDVPGSFPLDEFEDVLGSKLGRQLKAITFEGGDSLELELQRLLQLLAKVPRGIQRARLARRRGGWQVDLERPFTEARLSFALPQLQARAVFEELVSQLQALQRAVTWTAGSIEAPSPQSHARLMQVLTGT